MTAKSKNIEIECLFTDLWVDESLHLKKLADEWDLNTQRKHLHYHTNGRRWIP